MPVTVPTPLQGTDLDPASQGGSQPYDPSNPDPGTYNNPGLPGTAQPWAAPTYGPPSPAPAPVSPQLSAAAGAAPSPAPDPLSLSQPALTSGQGNLSAPLVGLLQGPNESDADYRKRLAQQGYVLDGAGMPKLATTVADHNTIQLWLQGRTTNATGADWLNLAGTAALAVPLSVAAPEAAGVNAAASFAATNLGAMAASKEVPNVPGFSALPKPLQSAAELAPFVVGGESSLAKKALEVGGGVVAGIGGQKLAGNLGEGLGQTIGMGSPGIAEGLVHSVSNVIERNDVDLLNRLHNSNTRFNLETATPAAVDGYLNGLSKLANKYSRGSRQRIIEARKLLDSGQTDLAIRQTETALSDIHYAIDDKLGARSSGGATVWHGVNSSNPSDDMTLPGIQKRMDDEYKSMRHNPVKDAQGNTVLSSAEQRIPASATQQAVRKFISGQDVETETVLRADTTSESSQRIIDALDKKRVINIQTLDPSVMDNPKVVGWGLAKGIFSLRDIPSDKLPAEVKSLLDEIQMNFKTGFDLPRNVKLDDSIDSPSMKDAVSKARDPNQVAQDLSAAWDALHKTTDDAGTVETTTDGLHADSEANAGIAQDADLASKGVVREAVPSQEVPPSQPGLFGADQPSLMEGRADPNGGLPDPRNPFAEREQRLGELNSVGEGVPADQPGATPGVSPVRTDVTHTPGSADIPETPDQLNIDAQKERDRIRIENNLRAKGILRPDSGPITGDGIEPPEKPPTSIGAEEQPQGNFGSYQGWNVGRKMGDTILTGLQKSLAFVLATSRESALLVHLPTFVLQNFIETFSHPVMTLFGTGTMGHPSVVWATVQAFYAQLAKNPEMMERLANESTHGKSMELSYYADRAGLVNTYQQVGAAGEEFFHAKGLLSNIPILNRVVKGSTDGLAMATSAMRRARFDDWMTKIFEHDGSYPDMVSQKKMATWLNVATGRGNIPDKLAESKILASLLGPRLFISRPQALLSPITLHSPHVTGEIVRDLVSTFGALAGMTAVAKMSGAFQVNMNPLSSNWGKWAYDASVPGEHLLDIWGGYQQMGRLIAQVIDGKRVTASGFVENAKPGIEGRVGFAASDITRYLVSHVAPNTQIALDIINGQDSKTQAKLGWDLQSLLVEVQSHITPIVVQQVIDNVRILGVPTGLAVSALMPLAREETYATPSDQYGFSVKNQAIPALQKDGKIPTADSKGNPITQLSQLGSGEANLVHDWMNTNRTDLQQNYEDYRNQYGSIFQAAQDKRAGFEADAQPEFQQLTSDLLSGKQAPRDVLDTLTNTRNHLQGQIDAVYADPTYQSAIAGLPQSDIRSIENQYYQQIEDVKAEKSPGNKDYQLTADDWSEVDDKQASFLATLNPEDRSRLQTDLGNQASQLDAAPIIQLKRQVDADSAAYYDLPSSLQNDYLGAHPDFNVERWLLYGDSLHSTEAVDAVLNKQASGLIGTMLNSPGQHRDVKISGFDRNIAADPQTWKADEPMFWWYSSLNKDQRTLAAKEPTWNAVSLYWGKGGSSIHSLQAYQTLDQMVSSTGWPQWNAIKPDVSYYFSLPDSKKNNVDKPHILALNPKVDAEVQLFKKQMWGATPQFSTPAARQTYFQMTGEDVSKFQVVPPSYVSSPLDEYYADLNQ